MIWSASILCNIGQTEYNLTLNAIQKQLPARNKVSLAIDGWTSMINIAITSVVDYYINWKWSMSEVQLVYNTIANQCFFQFEQWLRIACQGSTYCSTDCQTIEGMSSTFWTDWRPCTRDYNWSCWITVLDDLRITNNPWVLRNRVPSIERQCSQPSRPTPGDGSAVRHYGLTHGTAPKPSVPSWYFNDGRIASICRRRNILRPWQSSTDPGYHFADTGFRSKRLQVSGWPAKLLEWTGEWLLIVWVSVDSYVVNHLPLA